MTTHIVYIGLGSNLGDGPRHLDDAIALLGQRAGDVLCTSTYIESEPWGFESAHRFTNAVTALRTTLEPLALLDVTQQIEREMGRTDKRSHRNEPYHDRIIDIDLLRYDDLQYADDRLVLPHPLIDERPFVSLPLKECEEKVYNI